MDPNIVRQVDPVNYHSKMSLDIVLLFWEAYFVEGDKYLIIFIVVATLLFYKDKLMSVDSSLLP